MSMEASTLSSDTAETLSPDFRLASIIFVLGLGLGFIQIWVGLVIALLGAFLLIQTVFIRLTFTDGELQVCRGTTILRQFPYDEWTTWTIFWQPVPILFYFREVKSIHFLPMLFSPAELRDQLDQHCKVVGLID